ncbi:hypothetical protein TCDM_13122 [Trypanosoma cruzi Dm28c]|uniref:Uncharacterized protein n=1 Tax=Trypanosoma cruzi Dm28c TaxID=1416333 RepID=V5CJ56_TRYCR|nr:hypothetical protein TCDM_13122 [Trypanosoma cruzi Dm28c]
MLLNGFLVPGCWAMHWALRLRGVRSAPAPGNADWCSIQLQHRRCSQLDAEFHEAACPSFAAFSSGCGDWPVRQKWRAIQRSQVWCWTSSGPSAAAPPREARKRTRAAVRGGVTVRGGRRASVRSAGRSAMMKPCGFLAGCCGWRTMEALKRKALPRASHRGGAAALPPTRHPPLYCLSGFMQLFCSPATLRDPACSGTSGRRPNTICADAVRRLRPRQRYVQRPQCVSPAFPCKRQNR